MTDTGFAVPPAKLGRLVAGYWPDPATGALAPDSRPQAPVGTYGWDAGWGTIWRSDPPERT
jgi:CubicO group peptidase (beta-lactamase class C family)